MNYFEIQNRRYIGSKKKLSNWIMDLIQKECKGKTFCDIFAGTGIITQQALPFYNQIIVNDLLFSNNIIYKAFFNSKEYNLAKLETICNSFNSKDISKLKSNYFNNNFGNKFFNNNDAKLIGYIRENLNLLLNNNEITVDEFNILLASLLYSTDKIANTVGHYDAFFKKKKLEQTFNYSLIKPIDTKNTNIKIYRADANNLAHEIQSDIIFIDPPYNSRQYSRFYHVLENLTQWLKPELYGVALKPKPENMSDYCKNTATSAFEDLIKNLNCNYIAVTYNNTYHSKSSSSKNKISFEQIESILTKKGTLTIHSKEHAFFNAGKTKFDNHKEYLFLVKVGKNEK
jgi:adenine-specific DNA-methyltransferase